MVNVVLDADFLSAFLKIDALDRVREYFRTASLLVPSAAFREVAVTSLLPKLTSTSWLEVREVDASTLDAISGAAPEELGDLGAGEREAIALAHSLGRAVLLMNDKKALRSARAAGIRTVNIPAFLLLYRSLGAEQARTVYLMVEDLEEKDHYGFPADVRRKLSGTD